MKNLTHGNDLGTSSKQEKMKISKNSPSFQYLYDYIENSNTAKNNILISIVLPMYNEEKVIRDVLESLPQHKSIEVIVIDDHSTDNSINELEKAQLNNNICVIRHQKNKGYGGAIITGIQNANGEIIVTMDSDGQHSSDNIFDLIKPILDKETDYTIGSRYLGTYYYRLPLIRRFGEAIIEKLIRLLFGLKIKNNQNGFRAFKREIIHISEKVRYLDYTFCTEQILKARINGYKIKECPIKVYEREHGASKMIVIKLGLNVLSCFLIYFIEKIKRKIFFKGLKNL